MSERELLLARQALLLEKINQSKLSLSKKIASINPTLPSASTASGLISNSNKQSATPDPAAPRTQESDGDSISDSPVPFAFDYSTIVTEPRFTNNNFPSLLELVLFYYFMSAIRSCLVLNGQYVPSASASFYIPLLKSSALVQLV
jgi:hypothetical protein